MFANLGVLIIIVLCVVYFYFKVSALGSFTMVISAVFGLVTALNYYELAAEWLISKEYFGQWTHMTSLLILFFVGFALGQGICNYLVKININFGTTATRATVITLGIFMGLIVSGIVLIALAMAPLGSALPYERFPTGKGNIIEISGIKKPDVLTLNADGFVAGLFSIMSKGSLSSDKSFAVYHANFIDQLHANKLKADKDVPIFAGKDAITVPAKNGVRLREDNLTYVRTGFSSKTIKKGGAIGQGGKLLFTLSQARLICKKKGKASTTTGNAEAFYPEKCLVGDKPLTKSADISEIISRTRMDVTKIPSGGSAIWVDLAFNVPNDMTPVLLEFRHNAVTKVPKPVVSTEEIERRLNGEDNNEN